MDDLILPILGLFLLAVLACAIVLPIVALAIAIRSRRKLNQATAQLEAAYSSLSGKPLPPDREVFPTLTHFAFAETLKTSEKSPQVFSTRA
jgi:hypothetical protein